MSKVCKLEEIAMSKVKKIANTPFGEIFGLN